MIVFHQSVQRQGDRRDQECCIVVLVVTCRDEVLAEAAGAARRLAQQLDEDEWIKCTSDSYPKLLWNCLGVGAICFRMTPTCMTCCTCMAPKPPLPRRSGLPAAQQEILAAAAAARHAAQMAEVNGEAAPGGGMRRCGA